GRPSSWPLLPARLPPLGQQRVDLVAHERLAVTAVEVEFALPTEADIAFLVHQVDARPVLGFPRLPGLAFVVHGDGKGKAVLLGLAADRGEVPLAGGVGGVDA